MANPTPQENPSNIFFKNLVKEIVEDLLSGKTEKVKSKITKSLEPIVQATLQSVFTTINKQSSKFNKNTTAKDIFLRLLINELFSINLMGEQHSSINMYNLFKSLESAGESSPYYQIFVLRKPESEEDVADIINSVMSKLLEADD